mmetsp:Transcript_12288/g.29907  ORF Transcript_12288/g.29907 Transcript_12288/m.29907 type:complete len:148 (-) Transcript_12288:100-543(-)
MFSSAGSEWSECSFQSSSPPLFVRYSADTGEGESVRNLFHMTFDSAVGSAPRGLGWSGDFQAGTSRNSSGGGGVQGVMSRSSSPRESMMLSSRRSDSGDCSGGIGDIQVCKLEAESTTNSAHNKDEQSGVAGTEEAVGGKEDTNGWA